MLAPFPALPSPPLPSARSPSSLQQTSYPTSGGPVKKKGRKEERETFPAHLPSPPRVFSRLRTHRSAQLGGIKGEAAGGRALSLCANHGGVTSRKEEGGSWTGEREGNLCQGYQEGQGVPRLPRGARCPKTTKKSKVSQGYQEGQGVPRLPRGARCPKTTKKGKVSQGYQEGQGVPRLPRRTRVTKDQEGNVDQGHEEAGRVRWDGFNFGRGEVRAPGAPPPSPGRIHRPEHDLPPPRNAYYPSPREYSC